MKRALVTGRNGGKQLHLCVACDDRVDTCTSRAGKEIQKLRCELKGLRSRPGIKKKPVVGMAGRTSDVLRTRELLGSSRLAWEELQRLGYADGVGKCCHCHKQTLVLSEVQNRESNRAQLYAACQSCGSGGQS